MMTGRQHRFNKKSGFVGSLFYSYILYIDTARSGSKQKKKITASWIISVLCNVIWIIISCYLLLIPPLLLTMHSTRDKREEEEKEVYSSSTTTTMKKQKESSTLGWHYNLKGIVKGEKERERERKKERERTVCLLKSKTKVIVCNVSL